MIQKRLTALWTQVRQFNKRTSPDLPRQNLEARDSKVARPRKAPASGVAAVPQQMSSGKGRAAQCYLPHRNAFKPENSGHALKELSEIYSRPDSIADLESNPEALSQTNASRTTQSRAQTSVQSPHFQTYVLNRRKITVGTQKWLRYVNVYKHFQITKPDALETFDYLNLEGLDAVEVWLSFSSEELTRITKEYKAMSWNGLCEQEDVDFALETFLRRQRQPRHPPNDQKWRVQRMLHLTCPPNEMAADHWKAPPLFPPEAPADDFDWDIRSDCSYWCR